MGTNYFFTSDKFTYLRNVCGPNVISERWFEQLKKDNVVTPHRIVINCENDSQVGAHVELFSEENEKRGYAIVPMYTHHFEQRENLGADDLENSRRINDFLTIRKRDSNKAWMINPYIYQMMDIFQTFPNGDKKQKTIDTFGEIIDNIFHVIT